MLEICLFSLAWQLDPVNVERPVRIGSTTISTCVRPIVKTVEPDAGYATFVKRRVDVAEISSWLKKWEQSTSDQPAWNRSRLEQFRQSIQREFNEHTAVAAEQLIGQVSSEGLNETYQWSIVERTDKLVTLEAVPWDETDRLFYRSFRISLNVDGAAPEQIVVIGRNQLQRIAWQSGQRSDADRIQLVNFEDDTPPAPKRLLRTADSRID
jgi:hypothetical protein